MEMDDDDEVRRWIFKCECPDVALTGARRPGGRGTVGMDGACGVSGWLFGFCVGVGGEEK